MVLFFPIMPPHIKIWALYFRRKYISFTYVCIYKCISICIKICKRWRLYFTNAFGQFGVTILCDIIKSIIFTFCHIQVVFLVITRKVCNFGKI